MNYIKIGKFSIVRYKANEAQKERTESQLLAQENLKNNKTKGTLSKKARQRLINSISSVLSALESGNSKKPDTYRGKAILPTFVTLTLSAKQKHTDDEIKRNMLNRFLITLERDGYLSSYIWKAEKQKNGNIHFHLLVTNYIPHVYIRNKWNEIQDDNGYIEDYRRTQMEFHSAGFRLNKKALSSWSEKNQFKAYEYGKATNWSNPNSTDIHGLRKVRNTVAYIAKYMAKVTENEASKVDGHLWGRSDNVGLCEPCKIELTESVGNEILMLEDSEVFTIKEADYCTLYCFKGCNLLNFTEMELYSYYQTNANDNFFSLFHTTLRTVSKET